MKLEKFSDQIDTLRDSFTERDLEEYLLALYKNLTDNIDIYEVEELTLEQTLCILKECFTSESAAFNEEWLQITDEPDENRESRKFTNPDIEGEVDKTNMATADGMDFTLDVLKFQIAELHRMRGKQLEDEDRFFGVRSETGNDWYNFDPFSILECGTRCMIDNEEETENLDWSFIGDLLECGRIYE